MTNKPQYQNSGSFIRNRVLETRRDDDNVKNITVGLIDIDNAIKYYFDNVIKPHIVEDGVQIPVPVIMGSPERWKSVQKDGFYRDKKGVLMCPMIMFRRTSMEKKRGITRNLDPNFPNLYQSFERKYTPRNNYDRFSILTGTRPQREMHNIIVPDYMQISYECIIWTDYVQQMNKLQEAINYAESSYWGERDKFSFYAVINNISNAIEVTDGTERIIKATFELSINGYIIPDTVQKEVSQYSKRNFTVSKVKFGTEVSNTVAEDFIVGAQQASATYGRQETVTPTPALNAATFAYLRANKSAIATSIDSINQATFNGYKILLAPSSMPQTSVVDFSFFINGQYIPPTAIISFTDSSGSCVLILDTNLLGFALSQDDIVSAFGKFQ